MPARNSSNSVNMNVKPADPLRMQLAWDWFSFIWEKSAALWRSNAHHKCCIAIFWETCLHRFQIEQRVLQTPKHIIVEGDFLTQVALMKQVVFVVTVHT